MRHQNYKIKSSWWLINISGNVLFTSLMGKKDHLNLKSKLQTDRKYICRDPKTEQFGQFNLFNKAYIRNHSNSQLVFVKY